MLIVCDRENEKRREKGTYVPNVYYDFKDNETIFVSWLSRILPAAAHSSTLPYHLRVLYRVQHTYHVPIIIRHSDDYTAWLHIFNK